MQKRKTRLLSVTARKRCQEVAELKKGLTSQRAAALLAIDGGMSHSGAANATQMTLGQVKYAIELYRKKRLALFPADLLTKTATRSVPGAVREAATPVQAEKEKKVAKVVKAEKKLKKKDKDEKKLKKAEAVKAKSKKKGKKSSAKAEKKSKKKEAKKSAKKKAKGKKAKKK